MRLTSPALSADCLVGTADDGEDLDLAPVRKAIQDTGCFGTDDLIDGNCCFPFAPGE
ncbi:hypothetical protein ACGFWI_25150 [Streptomyces sp. NPDC048434]|uniref:hypothetical protein n=1 Tax=Streptomyces sp. NPDC048434 TaxID=3365549 RepID=UPI0037169E9C